MAERYPQVNFKAVVVTERYPRVSYDPVNERH